MTCPTAWKAVLRINNPSYLPCRVNQVNMAILYPSRQPLSMGVRETFIPVGGVGSGYSLVRTPKRKGCIRGINGRFCWAYRQGSHQTGESVHSCGGYPVLGDGVTLPAAIERAIGRLLIKRVNPSRETEHVSTRSICHGRSSSSSSDDASEILSPRRSAMSSSHVRMRRGMEMITRPPIMFSGMTHANHTNQSR